MFIQAEHDFYDDAELLRMGADDEDTITVHEEAFMAGYLAA